MTAWARRLAPLLATLAAAAAAGAVAYGLRLPLPWLLGPLLITAAAQLSGRPVAAPRYGRQTGQWLIGITLGLYFSPAVVAELVRLLPLIAIGALFALALGGGCAWLLRRLTGTDPATALFASMPGGASEMAVLGARNGARVDMIAAAHSLRIALVVLSVPALVTALGAHGAAPYIPAARGVEPLGLMGLLAVSALAGLLCQRLRWPNAWMLGALAASAALALTDTVWSALPTALSAFGQLLLGVALGSRFEPDFARRAPRFMAGVALTVAVSLLLCAAFAWLLAYEFAVAPASLLLAAAPGGIAEMCITAQALALGVPLITAYHVFRLVVVLTCTEPLWRLLKRRGYAM